MRSELRAVRTGGVPVVVDLTDDCADFVRSETDGLLHVFVPHATAGVGPIARATDAVTVSIDAPMGAEVPVTLTQWDMGFLRSLYVQRRQALQVTTLNKEGKCHFASVAVSGGSTSSVDL